jgi:arylsulfatase A-like enzyme
MRLLSTLACAPLLAAPAMAQSAPNKPNIVFVLADDLGYGDLSCYGNTAVKTENLDRLAREGLRFTQFCVASPICSPSRTGFLTGQFPARWKMTSYLDNRALNEQRGMAQWLDLKAPSLARFFQRGGYATGHFGKWHLGGGRDVGEAPLPAEYGFDASLTQFEGLGDRVLPLMSAPNGEATRKMPLGVQSEKLGRGEVRWVKREESTKAFVEGALQFIRRAQEQGKPFFVNVWPDDVHSPFDPPATRRGDGSKKARYHGVLQTMDEQLGPLFEAIRGDAKLRDNTIIIFTSDNGPENGAGSSGPFRGDKATLYEGGVRVPFIVWAPGLMAPAQRGKVNEKSLVSAVDYAPSLLALAGVAADAKFDGENLARTLLGHENASRRAPLFWKRPPDRPGPNNSWPDLAVREGNWKLLCEADGSAPQLYDLANDPGETQDLAEAQPEIAARLKKMLLDWNAAL